MDNHTAMSRAMHFRISEDQYRRYEAEAVAAGLRLSDFLRRRLEAADRIADELAQLRLAVLDGESPQSDPISKATEPTTAVTLEVLLLLRSIVPPSQLRSAHADIERMGLRPWSPASQS
ncbi:mobilisation protein [Bordetella ansorpii]|uniref:Mobilisation protein n=1 Tax=Bordetella ansorpii TaxID=288768 RepID=A0A157SS96_9BORD|nr:hypothetical protein [Bordetella ansorpii]SAI73184.1 mobilisation protein [Bordetella ansorpii]